MRPSLVRRLEQAGFDLTARELAEAIWLATFVTAEPHDDPTQPGIGDGSGIAQQRVADPDRLGDEPGPTREDAAAVVSGDVDLQGWSTGQLSAVPTVPPLANGPALIRVMRPLKRRLPVGPAHLLDEPRTVNLAAEQRMWLPVLRPEPVRWLDLVMMVDESLSMMVWRPTVRALTRAFRRLGAFRDIRHRSVNTSSVYEMPLRMPPSSARRLVLLVSDGVGSAWRDGRMHQALATWAISNSVAVVNPLPQRMWSGTGIDVWPAKVYTDLPGVPNTYWSVRVPSGEALPLPANTPIPVLELAPRFFAPWSKLMAGQQLWSRVALLTAPRDNTREVVAASAAQRIARFRGSANSTAFDLAVRLSAAAPLTMPVMRLVQAGWLPQSTPADLAAVLLGGLLLQVAYDSAAGSTFEFYPEVRVELQSMLRRADALGILTDVGAYLAGTNRANFSVSATFGRRARAGDFSSPSLQPLALVASDLLYRMGGPGPPAYEARRYPSLAQVPVDHGNIFGAEAMLQSLHDLVVDPESEQVVCIVGPGGTGKTTLAYELVARHANTSGFSRVAWITLGGHNGDAGWWSSTAPGSDDWRYRLVELARQLGLEFTPATVATDLPVALRRLGDTTRCLMVLDNIETAVELQRVLAYIRGADIPSRHKIILTSQLSALPDERVREVDWLGLNHAAARAFATYVADRSPGRLTRSQIEDVIAMCGGNPLLIRLAVGRMVLADAPTGSHPSRDYTLSAQTRLTDELLGLSFSAMRDQVGESTTARLINAFCSKAPGAILTLEEWYRRSCIVDRQHFAAAQALAGRLALVQRLDGDRFTVHPLIHRFVCHSESVASQ
jgi:hypothetical protein